MFTYALCVTSLELNFVQVKFRKQLLLLQHDRCDAKAHGATLQGPLTHSLHG